MSKTQSIKVLKFESKNPFAHYVTHKMWLSAVHHISIPLNGYSVRYRFPSAMLRFLRF